MKRHNIDGCDWTGFVDEEYPSDNDKAIALATHKFPARAATLKARHPSPRAKLPLDGECRIYMDAVKCIVLVPCWHLVACEECSIALNECPLCRSVVERRQKIFDT